MLYCYVILYIILFYFIYKKNLKEKDTQHSDKQ